MERGFAAGQEAEVILKSRLLSTASEIESSANWTLLYSAGLSLQRSEHEADGLGLVGLDMR